jgi:hypothetical protein
MQTSAFSLYGSVSPKGSFTYDAALEVFEKIRGEKLGEGGSREAFSLTERTILKYAKPYTRNGKIEIYDILGVCQTISEGIFQDMHPDYPLAKCKLFRIGNFPFALMEKVTRLSCNEYENLSEDHQQYLEEILGGDGVCQIGKTTTGKVVCYDYGIEYIDLEEGDKSDLMPYVMDLPEFTIDSIKEFENSLEIQTQTSLELV